MKKCQKYQKIGCAYVSEHCASFETQNLLWNFLEGWKEGGGEVYKNPEHEGEER